MWIMLNNKPFDLSKMKEVSEVIELSTDYIKSSRTHNYNELFPYNSFNDIDKKEVSECVINDKKKTFGYFFYINVVAYAQCYRNGSINGVEQYIKKHYSTMYETREAAQASLEHFLFETNGILSNLTKINI